MSMRKSITLVGAFLLAAASAALLTLAGEAPATTAPKAASVSEEEKKKLLEAEKPEQKKLREELAAFKDQVIYYNSSFEGRQMIYAVAPDGSGFKKLPTGDEYSAEYPRASADGKKIVFNSGVRKVSKEETLKLPCDPRYPLTDWTKRSMPGSFTWMMNVDGTDLHPVALSGSMPAWSADGKYLAYGIQPRPNVRKLGLVDLEARKEWIFQAQGGNSPCFTPDGKYYVGGAHFIELIKIEDIVAGQEKPKAIFKTHGCNNEVTADGKWCVHVVDAKDGSWLGRFPLDKDIEKPARSERLNLGFPAASMNYFPEVSPDCKYMVWGHWETTEAWKTGQGARYETPGADLYVTRWPPDGVNVRITWHGGTTQNPAWWAPKAAAKEPAK